MSAASCSRRAATGIAIWADRDMACQDINCANVSGRRRRRRAAAGSMTRPSCATGTPGRRPARARASSPSRWSTAGRRGGDAGLAEPRRRFAVQAVRRRRGAGLEPGRADALFHPARGRADRAQLDQSRHLRRAGRRQRRADQPDRSQSGMDTTPAVSPDGRWLAYTAMARPTYEADRQVVQLRNLQTGETRALTQAWDRSVGSIAWAADGRSPAGDRGRHARHAGLPRRRRDRPRRPG